MSTSLRHTLRGILVGFAVVASVDTVGAQPAAYITGSAFADMKRFGSTNGPYYYSSLDEKMSLDGTSAGAGVRIGTFLIPQLSLELSIDSGGRSKANLPDPYRILAVALPVRAPQLKASTQFLAVSTVLGFHPAPAGRVRLGYLGGLSFVRGTYKSDYSSYGGPVPLFTVGRPTEVGSSLLIFPPPIYVVSTLTQRDNKLGVVLGFEAAIELARHLAVVPEIRALTFAGPDAGPRVFLIRPGVGVRWSF